MKAWIEVVCGRDWVEVVWYNRNNLEIYKFVL